MSKRDDLPWFTADWPTRKKRARQTHKSTKSEIQTNPSHIPASKLNPLPSWGKVVFILALAFAIAFLVIMCVGIQQSLPPMEESEWYFPP